jgi:nitrite reductase (NADH) small subunit
VADWIRICALEDIPPLGARVVRDPAGDICVFRNAGNEVFALADRCPHRGGPLSQGIVHGRSVTCPLHGWTIDLANGEAVDPDRGCTHTYRVKVENGDVLLAL